METGQQRAVLLLLLPSAQRRGSTEPGRQVGAEHSAVLRRTEHVLLPQWEKSWPQAAPRGPNAVPGATLEGPALLLLQQIGGNGKS